METICQTPGSQFHIKITSREIGGIVELPFDVDVSSDEAEKLEEEIHNALEKILTPFFNTDKYAHNSSSN